MKKEFSLITDLNVLCNIPVTTLMGLSNLTINSICGDVLDTLESKETLTSVDLGIGVLNILIENDTVRYKFSPSDSMIKKVNDTIKNKSNPIEEEISKTISDKIKRTYKELF